MFATYMKLLDDFKIDCNATTKLLRGLMITLKAQLFQDFDLMKHKTMSLKHNLKENKSCATSFQS